ncbi:MAG: Glycerol-3-phosphate acyltransferase [Calditrichaeota bacterium]|nr:Glycerol-3-phosphate acyltransferase [Calditrichota bacterium]
MDNLPLLLSAMLAAYLIGSLPTAVLVARRFGRIDIRRHGSGNPGASNVFRVLGPRWATATLLVDVFKGYFPVWLVARVAADLVHPVLAENEIAVMGWVGFSAFAGHVYSPFLRFRGGKGAATALGAMFALAPQATTLAIIVYGGAVFLWKKFAAGTLAAAGAFPVLLYFREGGRDPESLLWGLIAPALLTFTHRANIRRLLRGSELPMNAAKHDNEEG